MKIGNLYDERFIPRYHHINFYNNNIYKMILWHWRNSSAAAMSMISTNHVVKINVTDLSDKKRYLVLKTEIPFVNGQN